MASRENNKGTKRVLRQIFEAMARTRTTAQESDQLHKLDSVRNAAYNEDEWKKALRPNENRPKMKKFLQERLIALKLKKPEDIRAYELTVEEKQRIEELARYREAIKYRDEATKLIKERRDSTDLPPERAAEIDRQLDHYYAYLMKLAHEDSYKVIYEREEKKYWKRDPKQGPRRSNESESDYRKRVAPEKADQRLKDVRLYIPGQPQPEPLADKAMDPVKRPRAVAQEAQRFGRWVNDRLQGERSGKYFTRLEGMTKESLAELGDQEAVRSLSQVYARLKEFSQVVTNLEDYGITIDEKPSTKKYKRLGQQKGQGTKLASPTRTITLKVADEHYIFTLYSDGFIDGDKKVPQPKDKDSVENISLRECRVSYSPRHHRPTLERINPTIDQISKNDHVLVRLGDVLRSLEDDVEAIRTQLNQ
jgi:hypothetical protein